MNSIEFYAHILKENEKLKEDTALLTLVNKLLSLQLKTLYKRDRTLQMELTKLIEQYKDV